MKAFLWSLIPHRHRWTERPTEIPEPLFAIMRAFQGDEVTLTHRPTCLLCRQYGKPQEYEVSL